MVERYAVVIEGLDGIKDIEALPDKARRAAFQAINKTADRARTAGARRILEQVNLPPSYLNPSQGRLTVAERARTDSLEARVRGRQRATSLARFVVGDSRPGDKAGLNVKIKAGGGARRLERAFLIRLRAGSASLDTKSNMGLAVRTSGEKPRTAYKPLLIGKNLWLLYGPSVDQVWNTVRDDITPETADYLEREFLRILDADF